MSPDVIGVGTSLKNRGSNFGRQFEIACICSLRNLIEIAQYMRPAKQAHYLR